MAEKLETESAAHENAEGARAAVRGRCAARSAALCHSRDNLLVDDQAVSLARRQGAAPAAGGRRAVLTFRGPGRARALNIPPEIGPPLPTPDTVEAILGASVYLKVFRTEVPRDYAWKDVEIVWIIRP